ncbi:MAG: hypothetical protein WCI91_00985 [Candidatus Nomurabacteria bacterium]
MKKILFFPFIFMTFVAVAQKVKKIELIHEDQAFKNAKIFYGTNNIKINDFHLNDVYVGQYYVTHEKVKEGFALADKLITTSINKLSKDKPNVIYTDRGQIVINWYQKKWNITFDKYDDPNSVSSSFNGVRIFSLKLNSLIKSNKR